MIEPFTYAATHVTSAPSDFMAGVEYLRSRPVSERVEFLSTIATGVLITRKSPSLLPKAAPTEAEVVAAAAARVKARGPVPLSPAQTATKNSGLRAAYEGYNFHQLVARELQGDFRYSYRGPDFTHRTTGVQVELTTTGELARHQARYNAAFPDLQYVTYR